MAKSKRARPSTAHRITLNFTPDEMKFLRRAAHLGNLTVEQLCQSILALRLAQLEVRRP